MSNFKPTPLLYLFPYWTYGTSHDSGYGPSYYITPIATPTATYRQRTGSPGSRRLVAAAALRPGCAGAQPTGKLNLRPGWGTSAAAACESLASFACSGRILNAQVRLSASTPAGSMRCGPCSTACFVAVQAATATATAASLSAIEALRRGGRRCRALPPSACCLASLQEDKRHVRCVCSSLTPVCQRCQSAEVKSSPSDGRAADADQSPAGRGGP
jgi:hypothetical protein